MLSKLNKWLDSLFCRSNTNNESKDETKETESIVKRIKEGKEPKCQYPVIEKQFKFPIKQYDPEIHNDKFLLSVWCGLTDRVVNWLAYEHFQLPDFDDEKLHVDSDVYLKEDHTGKYIDIHYKVDYLSNELMSAETQVKIRSIKRKLELLFDSFRQFDGIIELVHNELDQRIYNKHRSGSLKFYKLINEVKQKEYTYIYDERFYSKYISLNPKHAQDILDELHRLLSPEFNPLFTTALIVNPYRLYSDGSDIVLYYVEDIYNSVRANAYGIKDKMRQCFHKILNEHPEWFVKE